MSQSLLSSSSSTVLLHPTGTLECDVGGRFISFLCLVGAVALGLMLMAAVVLVVVGEAPASLLISSLPGAVLPVGLVAIAVRTLRRGGKWQVNTEQGVHRSGQPGRALSSIERVSTPIDWTDGTRLDLIPDMPRWLQLHLSDGSVVRVAKGGKTELAPVIAALQQMGVPEPS